MVEMVSRVVKSVVLEAIRATIAETAGQKSGPALFSRIAGTVNNILGKSKESENFWNVVLMLMLKRKFDKCFLSTETESPFDLKAYISCTGCPVMPDGRYIIWRKISRSGTSPRFFTSAGLLISFDIVGLKLAKGAKQRLKNSAAWDVSDPLQPTDIAQVVPILTEMSLVSFARVRTCLRKECVALTNIPN